MKSRLHNKSEAAFTLVEISIVLVIIGLLVGGVLVGRDLIQSSSLRADIATMQKLTTAVNTFKLQYNCLPGDCIFATQLGFAPSGQYYDNGDGIIRRNNGAESANECMNFWHHLSKANLIKDSASGYKSTVAGNMTCYGNGVSPVIAQTQGLVTTIGPGTGANTYSTADIQSVLGNIFFMSSIRMSDNYYFPLYTALQAQNIDSKVDDGLPYSVQVRIGTIWHSIGVNSNNVSEGCAAMAGTTYDITGQWLQLTGLAETTLNPGSIDCSLVWGKAY